MMDSNSVIAQATNGIVDKLAKRREISNARMYEQLGNQCVYPKAKLLIRDIASVDKEKARLIKADMDALWCEIFGNEGGELDVCEIHRETADVLQAILEKKPAKAIVKELRELDATIEKSISILDPDFQTREEIQTSVFS